VLEREKGREKGAEAESSRESTSRRLQSILQSKDAEELALRQRTAELEESHTQHLVKASAADFGAQVAEACARVAAVKARETVSAANARAETASRVEAEADSAAKRARAEAVSQATPSSSSPPAPGTPMPLVADRGRSSVGLSPLAAARARAESSSLECDQLRAMLNELSGTLSNRNLVALRRVTELEEERDTAEEERDKLLEIKESLTRQIAEMREAAHEAVRQVRLEQVRDQHSAALQVGEMNQICLHERRVADGARAETEAVLQRMGEHTDRAAAVRRQMEEMTEVVTLAKEEAKVVRGIASGLARSAVEAAERGAAAKEIRVPVAPPPAKPPSPGPGRTSGLSGEYWFNSVTGVITLL